MSLEAFYRRYNGVCNAHEFSRLVDFVANDVQVNGERQGLDGYITGLEAVVSAFPDYRWDLRHLLVDGAWVAAHFVDTGTHRGPFLGIPATGRKAAMTGTTIFRFGDNGKIVEGWWQYDRLGLMVQLGALEPTEL